MDLESKEKVDINQLQQELEVLRKEYRYTLRKMLERANLYDSSVLELKVNRRECSSLKKEIDRKVNELNRLQHQLHLKVTELENLKINFSDLRTANADLITECSGKDRRIEAFDSQYSSLTSAFGEKCKEVEINKLNASRLEIKLNVLEESYTVIGNENEYLKKEQMSVAEELSGIKIELKKNLVELNERRNQLRLVTIQFNALQKSFLNKKKQKRDLEKHLQQAKVEHDLTLDKLSKKHSVLAMLMGQIASMSNELALVKISLTEAESKIIWLRNKNKKQEHEIEVKMLLEKKISVLQSQLEVANSKNSKLILQYEEMLSSNSQKIHSFECENSLQSKQLYEERNRYNELADKAIEQRKGTKVSLLKKLSAFLNPRKRKLIKQIEVISLSPYFDAEWYLRNNLDVAYSSFDPIEHFLLFGADEGREPSLEFSCKAYCEENPDVAQSNVNPLLHYLEHGIKEGRKIPL
ncbi:hypothetical protein [Alteromonas sp. Mac1]|uniref:hypothetical protein n=1 Tax=Alteromonas sp. Mac1 TaxID=1777491 RepID=UPI0007701FA2|nr:hypothetical protein [Alteromonas sp. Mac1]AMJ88213.1 hypothetical protein AV939_17535 [Alteromonas sp. Mac1]AMJ92070.1 hypothetical protein AV940_17235 [Alteromonas sp. Mac2]